MRLVEPLQHLLAGVRRVLRAASGGAGADTDAGDFQLLETGGLQCLWCAVFECVAWLARTQIRPVSQPLL